jgi:putative ABC transport system permease protein
MRWFGRPDREYAEEIEEHIAIETRENIGRGMTPEDARLAARRTFGNAMAVREQLGSARPLHWLGTLAEDIRYGLRSTLRTPLLAGMILITLTAGIGLNTSVFTLLNALLFRAQVDKDPARFFSVYRESWAPNTSYSSYLAFREGTQHLGDLAATFQPRLTLDGEDPAPASAMLVSCNFFQVYGPDRPLLGRLFLAQECADPGGAPVAILSEKLWTDRFSSDPRIIGRTIVLSQHALTVVGVAASERFSNAIWVPVTMGAQFDGANALQNTGYRLKLDGRLKPGHSRSEVESALRVIARQQDRLRPGRRSTVEVTDGAPIHQPGIDAAAGVLLALGLPSLVLLIACVNVSTLLLARAASRQREMAVRISLGAGKARLVRMLLTESLMLTSGAAALSLWMAYYFPTALMKAIGNNSGSHTLNPDWTVFAYLAGIAFGAGCMAGLAPALESLKVNLSQSLKGQQMATDAAGSHRVRGFLVACQVALSLVLLAAAGLFAQAQYKKWSVGPDFETRKVLAAGVIVTPAKTGAGGVIFRDLEDRLRALHGVEAAAFAGGIFDLMDGQQTDEVTVAGASQMASWTEVSPEFFRVLGIPILRGRTFTAEEDRSETPAPFAIVTERFARLFWPGEEPLGKRFNGPRPLHGEQQEVFEVVGVARDSAAGLSYNAQAQYFVPRPNGKMFGTILLRFAGDESTLNRAVTRVLNGSRQRMIGRPQTLHAVMGQFLVLPQLVVLMGIMAMVLAVVGIYGVAAFAASQRTRELGIRLALGANRVDIVRLMVLQGVRPVLAGLAAGLLMTAGLVHGLAKVLKDGALPLNAQDPRAYAAVTIVLALAAVAAMLGPARRAAASDPLWALRQD